MLQINILMSKGMLQVNLLNLNAQNVPPFVEDANFKTPQMNGKEINSYVKHAKTVMCHNTNILNNPKILNSPHASVV